VLDVLRKVDAYEWREAVCGCGGFSWAGLSDSFVCLPVFFAVGKLTEGLTNFVLKDGIFH